jgi:hypothetical protein
MCGPSRPLLRHTAISKPRWRHLLRLEYNSPGVVPDPNVAYDQRETWETPQPVSSNGPVIRRDVVESGGGGTPRGGYRAIVRKAAIRKEGGRDVEGYVLVLQSP